MHSVNILKKPILIAYCSIITSYLIIYYDKGKITENNVVNFMKIPCYSFVSQLIINSLFRRSELTSKDILLVSFGISLYVSCVYPFSKFMICCIYND